LALQKTACLQSFLSELPAQSRRMSIRLAQSRSPKYAKGLVWLRRDLRAHDHAALYHALKSCDQVFVAFILDSDILQPLPRSDRRVEFILASLHDVDAALRQLAQQHHAANAEQVQLIVRHGAATHELPQLAAALGVGAVFCNHDYEPTAIARDKQVLGALANVGIVLHSFKDQVVFERQEVVAQDGRPYSVFTPYKRSWLKKITPFYLQSYPCERYAKQLAPLPPALQQPIPSLQDIDFVPSNLAQLRIPTGSSGGRQLLAHFLPHMAHYEHDRNYPAQRGVSYLSVHLRFGTLSIRELAHIAWQRANAGHAEDTGAASWLNELIWRDFYMQILAHRPDLAQGKSFKPAYDSIKWEKGTPAKKLFAAWCAGNTGYPLVDAAMRQLNHSGYMHNRLRMVAASFLCKHLGLDWRWGEAYFAEKLNDFDLAANNGGWQWAAGSGCDAQPYFRIFNPVLQSQKFDPDGAFIRRYVPELAALALPHLHTPWLADPIALQSCGLRLGSKAGDDYPLPIVDHREAVAKTKLRYAVLKDAP
jgi:deoxyribodipyrimidine photo-lyase